MKPPSRDETDIIKMRSYFYAKMRESDCPERRRRIWNIQKIRWNRITENGKKAPHCTLKEPKVLIERVVVERLKIIVRDVQIEERK